ncbi:MAG: hypothetical protein HY720_15215 [Planctomycetes bacterium]|nr:hypothetical protein [Planctomycetota bacterium]
MPGDLPDERAVDNRPEVQALLANLQARLAALEELLARASDHWGYEDLVYRFYHQSFKVFFLQASTERIVAALRDLAPDLPLNEWFLRIVREGTGKEFVMEDNQRWVEATAPILEAFFHTRFFLEMAVRYGRELAFPPRLLPSGWAALLYLYNLR